MNLPRPVLSGRNRKRNDIRPGPIRLLAGCALVVSLLLPIPLPAANQQIDLAEAIEYALNQNRSLVLASFNNRTAQLGINTAEAEFQLRVAPEIALNAADDSTGTSVYGLKASKKFRTGTEFSTRLISEDFTSVDGRQLRVVAEISQPLFRFGGRLLNEEPLVQAQSGLLRARRQLESQQQDLIVEVVRTYENILRLEQQLKADLKSYQRAEALLRSTRAKEGVGRATRVDTLRVELQQGQASSRVETGRERLRSARSGFAEVLGFEPDRVFALAPTNLLEVPIPGAEKLVQIAFENRMDFAQAIQDLQDAGRGVRIANKQLWPDVRLVARYTRIEDPVTPAGEIIDQNRWFVGLTAGTDFNRTREKIALGQAQVREQSSEQIIRILELSIARDIQQSVLAYRRAHADLLILERNLEYAQSRLNLSRRLFEIGRGDNFTVTDAEEAFVLAESQWLSGRSAALVSSYELMRTMGTLTEIPQDLRASVWW